MDLLSEEMLSPDLRTSERQDLIRSVADRISPGIWQELDLLQEEAQPPADLFEWLMDSLGFSVAQAFSVQDDEVAILLLKDRGLMLRFAYPLQLYADKTNVFPVSTPSIAREVLLARKGRIDNDVPEVTHLNIYERIRVKENGPLQIQKMISAPLLLPGGEALGVMQVSRKGESPEEAAPDFSPFDLLKLNDLSQWVAPYIHRVIPPDF
ncbi:MAG: hypothetical protein ACE5I9_08835 [Candidatus Methylomirabilales bacterium]